VLLIWLRRAGLTGGWPTQYERIFYVHHGSILTGVAVEAGLGHCPMCKALRAVEGLLLGYKGIQGAFREYWNIRGGISRGISGSREERSGVCRCLLAPYKVFFSSPEPPDQPGHLSVRGSLAFI
jgi:hypothetical protein